MIELHHADCFDILPTLQDGSVDLVLADLPYGTTQCAWDTELPLEPPAAHPNFHRRHQMADARILTNHEFPPIPDRRFDWSAIDENTYDGAEDSSCPVGHGATEQEAIDDLLDKICLARGADADRNNGCRYCTADPGVACRATIVSSTLSSQPWGSENGS